MKSCASLIKVLYKSMNTFNSETLSIGSELTVCGSKPCCPALSIRRSIAADGCGTEQRQRVARRTQSTLISVQYTAKSRLSAVSSVINTSMMEPRTVVSLKYQ